MKPDQTPQLYNDIWETLTPAQRELINTLAMAEMKVLLIHERTPSIRLATMVRLGNSDFRDYEKRLIKKKIYKYVDSLLAG